VARCGFCHTSARPIVGNWEYTSALRPSGPDAPAAPTPSPKSRSRLPAGCSGAVALRPSGPDAPGLGTSLPPRLPAAGCSGVPARRRPRPPAFIPSSAPRRLPVSAAPRRAWVPRRLPGSLQRRGRSRQPPLRLPAAPLRPPVLPPLIPLPLTLSLHPSVTLKSQLQNYSLTAAETREGKAAAGSSSMEQQPSSSRKGKRKAQGRGERSSVFWVLYRIGNLS